MLCALIEEPQTLNDLVRVTGLYPRVVSGWLRELREANLVHVAEWREDSRGYSNMVAAYTWLPGGADVERGAS